ncbi:MAG: hypothetical protein GX038_06175 [Erysipelothrix sp.]|nr:hypothetical protein [Erysipelothrix sp.]
MIKGIKKIAIMFVVMVLVTACSSNSKPDGESKTIDLAKLHTEIKEAYGEDYIPSMELQL